MTQVKVFQITSECWSKAYSFFNVEEKYEHVKVWGHVYKNPTYLIMDKSNFELIQFDDDACALDYLGSLKQSDSRKVFMLDTGIPREILINYE